MEYDIKSSCVLFITSMLPNVSTNFVSPENRASNAPSGGLGGSL